MNKNIIDTIEGLKPHTDSVLRNNQIVHIPHLIEMEYERRYSFDIHGVYHSIYRDDCLLFVSNTIPLEFNQKRHTFADSLENLVDSKEVQPFLLFINGLFIKWSDIIIVKDCKYSYILVNNLKVDKYDIQLIVLPKDIIYQENSKLNSNINPIFVFEQNGEFANEPNTNKKYTLVLKKSEDDFKQDNVRHFNAILSSTLISENIKENNIITFRNGLLYTDRKVDIPLLGFISIDDNKIPYGQTIVSKVFYKEETTENKDNIQRIRNKDKVKRNIKILNTIPQYLKELNKPFDFKYNRFNEYEENVYNALSNIMQYNSSLLNKVYENKNNIISRIYKGKQILSLLDKQGYYKISTKIEDEFVSGIIVLLNGELHPYYSGCTYYNTYLKIYIGNSIKEEDILEFIYFKNVENKVIPIVFDSRGDDTYYISPNVNMENMKLFAMDVYDKEFMIETKEDVQYELDYVYKKSEETRYKIYPKDNYYYHKRLNLVSNRQFLYCHNIIKEDNVYDLELPDTFKYCNNQKQFMIFINGRKIDNKNYKITITKKTRPFDDLAIYVNITLNKSDTIDIFYLPEEMEELVVDNIMDITGKIVIDKSKLSYNFDKDLYLIFANGKKLNRDQLQDIDQTRIMITEDIKTLYNLTIIKYIKDDEYLAELFKQDKDEITKIFDKISSSQLDDLFKGDTLTNIEKDIKSNTISMTDVMYKIIKDYWMRPYINDGDSFLYDFDEEFLEKDEDGNIIIRVLDSSEEGRIE